MGMACACLAKRIGQPAAGAFEGTIQPTVPQGVSPLPCALDGTGQHRLNALRKFLNYFQIFS